MAIALSLCGLLCLTFIAWLTIDGLRAIFSRRAQEAARKPLTLIVAERREIGSELLCLQLKDAKGKPLKSFAAGQHLLLQAPAGHNGKIIRRAYSLAAWSARPMVYELGIKREEHGVMSQWLWANLQAGERVVVSRPQGHFIVPKGKHTLVLIGGGIGITPMRAMLHEALASERPIVLFHAARTAELLLYRAEFEALARQHAQFDYQAILSRPDLSWSGPAGHLDALRILANLADATQADFYLCAGNQMMDSLRQILVTQGIAPAHIHSEAFGSGAGAGLAGLTLTVNQHGVNKSLQTAGEPSLLATLEASGIELPSECRAGSCGQCVATLDDGEIEWLTVPEALVGAGKILPCICRAKSNLTLSIA